MKLCAQCSFWQVELFFPHRSIAVEQPTPLQSVTGETELNCASSRESHQAHNSKRPWSTPQMSRHAGQSTGKAMFTKETTPGVTSFMS